MAKKKISNSFMIGIFVIAGLAVLVGFIMWMGATQFFKEYDYYVTYFEDSVSGLENGSPVKYLGVSCGVVQSIQIAPDGKLIEIVMKLEKNLNISNDLVVKMEMAGLAGGKFLQLYAGTNNVVNNFDLNFKTPHKVLNSAPSSLDELAITAGSIITELNKFKWQQVSDELVGTLEGTNRLVNHKDLALILTDLRATTISLNNLVDAFSASNIIDNLAMTTNSFANSALEIQTFSTNLNTKLNELDIPTYLNKYYSAVDSSLTSVNKAVDNISNNFQSSLLGANVLLDDLTKTNKSLKKTLNLINDSPYLFLTNPPPAEEIEVTTKK
jgi:phospholipid/cholesterol/gamma-HCH transport system substrate-binding protein